MSAHVLDSTQKAAPTRTDAVSTATLTFRELLDYTAEEAGHWRTWLGDHPVALDIPFGEGRWATVRHVIQHIFAVERRYSDRLLGDPVSPVDVVAVDSIDSLFEGGRDARERLERYLSRASEVDLARRLEFTTLTAGTLSANARKIVAHTLLHAVRTWAQVTTVVREHGHKTDWDHDLLTSTALT
jgi:uncharacterized damage-inducible protein DinB